jgi:Tfp pilus assembly protein PilN
MKAVNLLPNDQRSAPKAKAASRPKPEPTGGVAGAFMVLGAMAFVVFAVAAFVLAGNTVKERQAELTRVQADAAAIQGQLAALKPYADFQTVAAQRVATVTQLAQGRFDWEQALRDLSRALPTDVRLKSLRGSVSGSLGGSSNALRGALQAPALELSGCTKTQSGVARVMSRLRTVRGVTRVSLSKSERPAPAATGSGAVAVADSQGALCGKGRPPAFEVVVFFERSAAQASAAQSGAVAATPATGQTTTPADTTSSTGQTQTPAGQSSPSTTGVSAP